MTDRNRSTLDTSVLFTRIRFFARDHHDECDTLDDLRKLLDDYALEWMRREKARDGEEPTDRDRTKVLATSRRVAEWTWENIHLRPADYYEIIRLRKEWSRTWARLRREYLDNDRAIVGPVVMAGIEPGTVRWECPVCGDIGSDTWSASQAEAHGRVHMQTHISDDDHAALEALKVTHMPEALLTPYQRNLRDQLKRQGSE